MKTRETYVFDNGGITADRYTVVIDLGDNAPDFHCWYMSPDAAMPNGVCMYGGVITEPELSDLFADVCNKSLGYLKGEVPKQVKAQISRIVEG